MYSLALISFGSLWLLVPLFLIFLPYFLAASNPSTTASWLFFASSSACAWASKCSRRHLWITR